MIVFRISDEDAGKRIDKIVARRLREFGRRAAAELFAEGRVRVDGRAARKGDVARVGSVVEVDADERDLVAPEPDAPLAIALETDQVVVIRKPAGQPTAPIHVGETGTLANAILGRYPETRGVGHRTREPGLLHRLDTQTSGLVVVTRTAGAFTVLRQALSAGKVAKRYLAVVSGSVPESGTIRQPLLPDPSSSRRVRVVDEATPGARPANTRFRRIRSDGTFTLLEAEVSHAYRHQVRAHLAALGNPIVGDALYGGTAHSSLGERHALHASYVAWTGDETVPAFAVEDGLPEELDALLSR